ncbi:MAG: lipopolysaccharide biosynthesis protein [Fimbriimonadaceae bacterium]|nr:lipopolysaccharide biosynthesis protein [Fimbriimonadaceae bacterium]
MANLRSAAAYSFLGYAVYSASNIINFLQLNRAATITTVGTYTLAVAITSPVFDFLMLQLRGILNTDARQEFRFSDYFTLRLIAMTLAVFVSLAIGAVTDAQQLTPILLFFATRLGVEGISDVMYGFQQQSGSMKFVGISMAARGAIGIAAFALGTAFGDVIAYGLPLYLLGSILLLLGLDYPQARRARQLGTANPETDPESFAIRWNFRPAALPKMLLLVAPLAVTMLLISLHQNVMRYFLEASFTRDVLAIFTAATYLTIIGRTVVVAVGQASSTELARAFTQRNWDRLYHVRQRLRLMTGVLAAATIALGAIGGTRLMTVAFGPEYRIDSLTLVVILTGGAVSFFGSINGYVLTAMREIKVQLPIRVASLLSTVAWAIVAVPQSGLLGAAIATLVGNAVQLAWGTAVADRTLRTHRRAAEAAA